jgi:hypothetical protein
MRSHSTTDAAKVLTRACGRTVGEHFVHRVFHDLYGEKNAPGPGRPIRLTDRQVDVFRMYAVVNYNRRPPVPVREWLRDNGIPVPRMAQEMKQETTAVAKVKPPAPAKQPKKADTSAIQSELKTVRRELAEVREQLNYLLTRDVASAPARQITSSAGDGKEWSKKIIRTFVKETTEGTPADFKHVHGRVYRSFFTRIGGQEVDRWKVGRDYESTIDYIDQQGLMPVFCDVLPKILEEVRLSLPTVQQDLFE